MHNYQSIKGLVKTKKEECLDHLLSATCNDGENDSYPMKIFYTTIIRFILKKSIYFRVKQSF